MGNRIALNACIAWNHTTETYTSFYKSTSYFFQAISDYRDDRHNKWVFIPNYTIPVPLPHVKNNTSTEWIYYSTKNVLSSYTERENRCYKVGWLSAKLQVTINEEITEYDMDEFLSSFVMQVDEKIPTLSMIYTTWCIYTKQWFPTTASICFHIIDSNGEEQELLLHNHKYVEIRARI